MNELKLTKNKRKVYITLLVTVLCLIMVSYAYFTLYLRQSENNTVTSLTCFSTSLTEENSAINITDEYPITDEKGLEKIPFSFKITNNCSTYVKVWVTVESTKEGTSGYILSKYMKANVSFRNTVYSDSLIIGNQQTTKLDNGNNGYILLSTGLTANQSKELDLRLWIDYDTTASQAAGLSYQGKIVIVSQPANEPPSAPDNWYDAPNNTLLAAIRDNNEVSEPLTVPGKEVSGHVADDVTETTVTISSTYQNYYWTYGTAYGISSSNNTTGTSYRFSLTNAAVTTNIFAQSYADLIGKYIYPDTGYYNSLSTATLNKTSDMHAVYYVTNATPTSITYKAISTKNSTESLIGSTEDDYGTSYYYRGVVENNYLVFANKCWRIVRITGNGAIKITLYNNSSADCTETGDTLSFLQLNNETAPSFYSNGYYASAKVVSLMYGTGGIIKSPLAYIEQNTMLLSNEIENDGVIAAGEPSGLGESEYSEVFVNTNKSVLLTNLEAWYSENLINYGDYLEDVVWCNDHKMDVTAKKFDGYDRYYNGTPSLVCQNDSLDGDTSKYTVEDTVYGNGDLTYKIGLLTADELMFAGASSKNTNRGFYLYANAKGEWWTQTPGYRDGDYYSVFTYNVGLSGVGAPYPKAYLRPSIALKSSVEITGSGTASDPFVVK